MIILRAARRPAGILAGLALLAALTVGGTLALGPNQAVSSIDDRPAATPHAPADRGATWGIVLDRNGGVVAGAHVAIMAIDGDTAIPEIAMLTGADGRYQTIAVPGGRYELTFGAVGFRPAFVEVTIENGAIVRAADAVLEPEA